MGKSRINTRRILRAIDGRIASAIRQAHEQRAAEVRREQAEQWQRER
jgi:hypothetical protein